MAFILSPPPLHINLWGVDYIPLYTNPLIRQQGTGLISQHVVTSQCPLPPLTTTINIFTPLNGTFLINECCSAAPSRVSRCPSKHPFCPQITALPSCQKSPWWWPFRGYLDKVGSNVFGTPSWRKWESCLVIPNFASL